MRPLLDLSSKQDKLRIRLEQKIEGKKLSDEKFNEYVIQAYKLSKRKEAALDELNEEGLAMFTPDPVDPREVDLKSKLLNKPTTEAELERQGSIKKKPVINVRRSSFGGKSDNSTSMNMTIEDDEGHVIDLDNNGIFNEDRLLG